MSRPALSVVGPVYNEEKALPEVHRRLMTSLEALGLSFEVIYVDDASRDGSLALLRRLRAQDERVKVLSFSRNFGHQMAITAGMDHARGQACVVMDTDGQDPPELIGRLLESWKQGHEVVYAVRLRREGEGFFKKATASLFYRLMRRITHVDIPLDAGDFRLVDRKALEVLKGMRETHRFIRGLTSWVGFSQAKVSYAREKRLAGQTNYPFFKMLRLATDGITSFSHEPLRWVTVFGLASFAVSVAIGLWVLQVRLFNPAAVRGWTSLMAVVLFLGGVQLIAMGVIGEYLARIFDEVKGRPLYVLRLAEGIAPEGARPAERG